MFISIKENTRIQLPGTAIDTSMTAHQNIRVKQDPLTSKPSAALLTFVEGLFMDDNYLCTESCMNIEQNCYSSNRIETWPIPEPFREHWGLQNVSGKILDQTTRSLNCCKVQCQFYTALGLTLSLSSFISWQSHKSTQSSASVFSVFYALMSHVIVCNCYDSSATESMNSSYDLTVHKLGLGNRI
jgi:hypothetical protein